MYQTHFDLDPIELAHAIADELAVPVVGTLGMHALQKKFREVLIEIAKRGDRVVAFVDEAQTLPDERLEELRLLSNLEANQGKLIQVALFGQPELDTRLERFEFRQLQQRISFSAQSQVPKEFDAGARGASSPPPRRSIRVDTRAAADGAIGWLGSRTQ